MGMEYYDSINNNLLYSYYCQKNVAILTDTEVISFLDNNPKIDLLTEIKLFNKDHKDDKKEKLQVNCEDKENIRKTSNHSRLKFVSLDNKRDISLTITRPINNYSKEILNSRINQEIDKLKYSVDKINDCIEKEITNQVNSFHQRRLKKLGEISMMKNQNSIKRYIKRNGSKLDDIIIGAGIFFIKYTYSFPR
jgi:hypothetical protein